MPDTTAYLCIGIDYSKTPPTVVGADIFSEPRPTMCGSVVPVVVESHTAADYATASRELREHAESKPWLRWVMGLPSRTWGE